MTKPVDRNVIVYGKNVMSQQAADAFFLKSGSWRKLVYGFVNAKGFYGATDQEIQAHFDKSGDTIRPTRKTLEKDGLIIDSGRTRKNVANNECIVWVTYENEGRLL